MCVCVRERERGNSDIDIFIVPRVVFSFPKVGR